LLDFAFTLTGTYYPATPFILIYFVVFFSDDASVAVDVQQHMLTAQMQEKGRRLAQELPGFNWLEEKIRNGGVTTVLPPKRLSGAPYSRNNGGSVGDAANIGTREIPTSEAIKNMASHVPRSVTDAARSSVLPPSSSPPEYRLVT
jgi:hypothetical protein